MADKSTFIEKAMDLLDHDKLGDFLDFVGFIKESQIKLPLTSGNGFSTMIYIKNKKTENKIGALNLNSVVRYKPDGSWSITPNNIFWDDYDKHITDEKLKEFVLNSINYIK